MSSSDSQLYDEQFTITSSIDGKYERVKRINCISHSQDTSMELDINKELFEVSDKDDLQVVIATTLNLDGTKDDSKGWKDWARGSEQTLADMFDYVCRGKIYRFEQSETDDLNVYISFGGLLMHLTGPFKKLTALRVDYVYLLVKK